MEEYLVQMKGISKFFPGVVALDKVDFELRAGEVHALLGENGAGKSTLMKIIGGIYQKDEGEVKIRGKTQEYSTVAQASELGIAVIHQELNMCRHLTVAENIFLGRELKKGGMVDFKEQNARASKLLKELSLNIEPDTEVGKLSVSKQQMVEIAKALSTNADIIIMDEPSSALTERETQELFRIINELKNMGKGIIYISHRLEELENIVDRVTVMRDGKYIKTADFKDLSIGEIIALMVGREITEKYPHEQTERGKKIMEVKGIRELMQAVIDLHDPHIKLLILGSANSGKKTFSVYERKIQKMAGDAPDKIIFTGYVDNAQVPLYAAAADVQCVPTLCEEAAPLVVLEAMAEGLPLIVTRSGGIPEYVGGDAALFVERDGIVNNLQQAILYLKEHPALRKQMAQAAQTQSRQYDESAYYRNFVRIIGNILKNN